VGHFLPRERFAADCLEPARNEECASREEITVQIRFGYELTYAFPQSTPMILMLRVHPSRTHDVLRADDIHTEPALTVQDYVDGFGNRCSRLTAPAGRLVISADGLIEDTGLPEPADLGAAEHDVANLPEDTLVYLLGSRYCETELLMQTAWQRFGSLPPGWSRVQAICDFVNAHIQFGYRFARPTKTAFEAFTERQGVCRDFAHLAITLCRCLNIPARYCTGYLGDIGVPPAADPMDFAGWFEAYLGGRWHTFDPRNNQRRIGRILIGRGRDAGDVAISTTFGANFLEGFRVWTDEVAHATEAPWPTQSTMSFAGVCNV
jgi:transglutaminase-like putative cysteine protease